MFNDLKESLQMCFPLYTWDENNKTLNPICVLFEVYLTDFPLELMPVLELEVEIRTGWDRNLYIWLHSHCKTKASN